MKKIKLFALMFLAGAMIFTSCNKDDDETTAKPTISFSNGSSYEVDFTQGDSVRVVYSADIKADGEIKSFTITQKVYVDGNITPSAYDADVTDDFKGATSKTYHFDKWFKPTDFISDTSEVDKIVYVYSVTDKEDQNVEKEFTVTKKQEVPAATPLSDATPISWKRVGGNPATGLSGFGLKWTSNAKVTHAQITKDTAEKLVIFTSNEWANITSKEALAAAVENGTDVSVYDNVSTSASADYDDVIATKVGSEYFIIHITKAIVTSDQSGTTVEIQGESKN